MKRLSQIVSVLALVLFLAGCSAKKQLVEVKENRDVLIAERAALQDKLNDCNKQKSVCETMLDNERNRIKSLEENLNYFKKLNQDMMDRLALISESGAASIQKSLDALQSQNSYIQKLNADMQKKDSLALSLVMNLKRSLESGISDEDVTIEVKKGVVYISLSDKMLFKSGSSAILNEADKVLSKVAKVVKDHQDFDILVEGHTDNVPINTDCLKDNWDLSVMRSTAVVRSLQNKHGVKPERMTAGGRGQWLPKDTNETAEGRSKNRRTEIIILPKLDEFFSLLNSPGTGASQEENKK